MFKLPGWSLLWTPPPPRPSFLLSGSCFEVSCPVGETFSSLCHIYTSFNLEMWHQGSDAAPAGASLTGWWLPLPCALSHWWVACSHEEAVQRSPGPLDAAPLFFSSSRSMACSFTSSAAAPVARRWTAVAYRRVRVRRGGPRPDANAPRCLLRPTTANTNEQKQWRPNGYHRRRAVDVERLEGLLISEILGAEECMFGALTGLGASWEGVPHHCR